ncbi:MAG: hypothetical protein RLZZ367_2454 [Bacteroidota bacterium]|jgi:hypothetical protein
MLLYIALQYMITVKTSGDTDQMESFTRVIIK